MSQSSVGPEIADKIIADLAALGVDAKRKNPEIRHACDHSIELLKPFSLSSLNPDNVMGPSGNDSPALVDTLRVHPEFIVPLLMACHSKNTKLIGDAVKCLSKIIQLKLLPSIESTPEGSPEPIDGVVDALMEASNAGPEIQVKILQLLPSFFQLYAFRVNAETLSKMLYICTTLQAASKGLVIINTAQATFSQLIDIAFEKVTISDTTPDKEVCFTMYEVPIDNDKCIQVKQSVYDAQRLVSDLCTLIEHHKPSFLKTNYITEDYGFEILESLIKNNSEIFLEHVELSFLLRTRVAPILLRFVSSSKDFTLMVKVSRLIFLLLNDEFDVLRVESEVTLTLLTHILSKNSGAPQWKKTMVLEIYVGVFKNHELLKKIFMAYDNNPTEERKSVVDDLLKVCLNIVHDQKNVLNTGDLIQLPATTNEPIQNGKKQKPQQLSQRKVVYPPGLRAAEFTKTIRLMDSIEKQEPPQTPPSYDSYLISQILIALSDCVQSSTLSLMKAANPAPYISEQLFAESKDEKLKVLYECICDLITNTWALQLEITDIFIHSTLDNELFSGTLKLLENLCYCSGVLSLNKVKQSILKYLSVCTLKLDGRSGYQSRVMTIGESIVGTISSTLGQAVSNMSNNGNNDVPSSTSVQMYPRTINTRQTLCFHTLIRLGVSLGSHLHDDWEIILIVLQWVSYYIDGTSGMSKKDVPPLSPYLMNRDLQIIEHSLSELSKSIFNQDETTFSYILKSLISLSEKVMTPEPEREFGQSPLTTSGEIQPCIFNKLFYVNKLTDICVINPIEFMIYPENNFDIINDYFCKIADDRSNSDETRLLASRSFNQIAKASAETGFEDKSIEIHELTETKVLNNMCKFMTRLSQLPMSNELLIANCEAEMYLQTLETLKNIIDRFGSLIQHTWGVVTEMLDFPFLIISNCDSDILKEKIINDIIVSVLKSSFETMKVVLDEILQCIPKNQIKVIIDSLYHFVEQNFDLNISFNSVSYFWLISDYIKDKLETNSNNSEFNYSLASEAQLIEYVSNDSTDDYQYYQYLWIYLVLQLAKTSPDKRVQVRNGAILTTFSVIQSFLTDASQYSVLYDIVIRPVILQIKPPESTIAFSSQDQKDWMESFINITNGLTKLLFSFMNSSFSLESPQIITMWQGIMEYFVGLLNLDFNWVELNNQIFKNFYEILHGFKECDKDLPKDVLESLFEPWASVKINYNLAKEAVYQTSLCSFVDCFPLSMHLFKPIMTTSKFEKMLMILNSCIRYPILVDSRNDNMKCTALQQAVLDNLSLLEFDKSDSSYISYESLLIQQLNLIVVLPFHTRDLIVKKLGDKGIKIPTFVAASYQGLQILERHLAKISDLTYFNDRSILKVIKSLLEPSKLKSDIYFTAKSSEGEEEKEYLWVIGFRILVNITLKVLNLIMDTPEMNFRTEVNIDSLTQVIPLALSVFDCCFISSVPSTKYGDNIDLEQYQKMRDILLKFFNMYYDTNKACKIEKSQIEQFISSVWYASFYHNQDIIIESILPPVSHQLSALTMDKLAKELIRPQNWDIYGTTRMLNVSPRLRLSIQCFDDLVLFVNPDANIRIWRTCLPFFISRCTLVFRKYLMDIKLLGGRPVSRILIVELRDAVNGLQTVLSCFQDLNTADSTQVISKLKSVYSMLIELLPKVSEKDIEAKLLDICLSLGNQNLIPDQTAFK